MTYKIEKKRKRNQDLQKKKRKRKNYRLSRASDIRLHRNYINRALYSIDNFDERRYKTFLTEKLTYCKNCYAFTLPYVVSVEMSKQKKLEFLTSQLNPGYMKQQLKPKFLDLMSKE